MTVTRPASKPAGFWAPPPRPVRTQPTAPPSLPQLNSASLPLEDQRAISLAIAHSIQGTTEVTLGVPKAERLWTEFILGQKREWDPHLQRGDLRTRIDSLLAFLLAAHRRGLSADRMRKALVHVFTRARSSPALLLDPVVIAYSKGQAKMKQPLKAVMKRRFAERKVPLPLSWILASRARYMRLPSEDDSVVDSAFAYLALIAQAHTGDRVGNFAHATPDESRRKTVPISRQPDDKHAVRGGDVLFYYNESLDPSSTIDSRDKKQDRIIASHKWLSDPCLVFAACFLLYTKKNQSYHCTPKWVRRGSSAAEDHFLEDLVLSRRYAPMGPEDLFFSRMSQSPVSRGSVKRLLSREVTQVNKDIARAKGCTPANFSSTSARSVGISSLAQYGLPEDALLQHSGHKTIAVTKGHYIFKGALRRRTPSALAITPDQGFDEEDLTLLLMAMKTVRDQVHRDMEMPRG